MPRIRSLKPELVSDVKLARVSRDARYTFVLMITQADDLGLLAGAHRQLLGALYPLDEDVTAAVLLGWVEELVSAGLVRWRSTRDGVPVIEITNWSKHQRIDNAGRSQLGALLAESPAEQSDPPSAVAAREFAEVRGESPRVAEIRGLDHRSPTEDLGPGIKTTGEAAREFARAANQGLADHPTAPQPIPRIMATNGTTHKATEKILAAGVPVEFAARVIYELASTHAAEDGVSSLGYFAAAVVRRWGETQATEDATGERPGRAPSKNQVAIHRAGASALAAASVVGLRRKGDAA